MRILFVCLGNICRSPMAEGIMKEKVRQRGLRVEVDSCGTGDYHEGENPDPRAREEMEKRGFDISELIARGFRDEDFEHFDRILTMDEDNQQRIKERARNAEEERKVDMLLNLLPDTQGSSVPDPYFGAKDGFKTVYELLDRATDALIKEMEHEPEKS